MEHKEYRSRITDLFVNSMVELIVLADQAVPSKETTKLKEKVESTVANMLTGYITEYIESVVTQMNDQDLTNAIKSISEDTFNDDSESETIH